MATEERYNGWTNYETWAVALWINKDQGWQESVHEDIRLTVEEYREEECDACEGGETHPLPAYRAGQIVREHVERVVCFDFGRDDTMPANLSADLVGRALDRVDWDELGASFLANVAEQDAYENGEGLDDDHPDDCGYCIAGESQRHNYEPTNGEG